MEGESVGLKIVGGTYRFSTAAVLRCSPLLQNLCTRIALNVQDISASLVSTDACRAHSSFSPGGCSRSSLESVVRDVKKLSTFSKSYLLARKDIGGYSSPIIIDPTSRVRNYAARTYSAATSACQNLHVLIGALGENVVRVE
jgi:hypothetical protein